MKVRHGDGETEDGPGVLVEMTRDEVARAIDAYLVAHGIAVRGARTIRVNGALCDKAEIYVDPSGFVIAEGEKYRGDGGPEPLSESDSWLIETLEQL